MLQKYLEMLFVIDKLWFCYCRAVVRNSCESSQSNKHLYYFYMPANCYCEYLHLWSFANNDEINCNMADVETDWWFSIPLLSFKAVGSSHNLCLFLCVYETEMHTKQLYCLSWLYIFMQSCKRETRIRKH